MVSFRSVRILLPVFLLFALASASARADAPPASSLTFSDTPPLSQLKVRALTSLGQSAKKFAGAGMLTFLDGVEIELEVVAKRKVNKKDPGRTKVTYILKSPRGALPKVKVKFRDSGGCAAVPLPDTQSPGEGPGRHRHGGTRRL